MRREIARDKAEQLARNGKLSGKLSVDGYKPSGQDMKTMSRAMDEQDKLLKEAGIRKEPKKLYHLLNNVQKQQIYYQN